MTWIATDEKNNMLRQFNKCLLPNLITTTLLRSYQTKIKILIMLCCPPMGNLEEIRLPRLFERIG